MRIVIYTTNDIELIFQLDEAHEYVDLLTTRPDSFFSGARITTRKQDGYLEITVSDTYSRFLERLNGRNQIRYTAFLDRIRRSLPPLITLEEQTMRGSIFIFEDTHETIHSDKVRKSSNTALSFLCKRMKDIQKTMNAANSLDDVESSMLNSKICLCFENQPFVEILPLTDGNTWKWEVAEINTMNFRMALVHYPVNHHDEVVKLVKQQIFNLYRRTSVQSTHRHSPYPVITVGCEKVSTFKTEN